MFEVGHKPKVTFVSVANILPLFNRTLTAEFARLNMTGRKRVRLAAGGREGEGWLSVREKCNNVSLPSYNIQFQRQCIVEMSQAGQ